MHAYRITLTNDKSETIKAESFTWNHTHDIVEFINSGKVVAIFQLGHVVSLTHVAEVDVTDYLDYKERQKYEQPYNRPPGFIR